MRIAVLGMGASGQAAARLALSLGHSTITFDDRAEYPIPDGAFRMAGPFEPSQLEDVDQLIVSPGVSVEHVVVSAAQDRSIPVIGELGYAFSKVAFPVIAVTGTNGKSTVSWFIHQLLEQCGIRSFLGGNFGEPLSVAVVNGASYDVGVVEVSSYQLEFPGDFSPAYAAITNLTPDHLARHKTVENYGRIKLRIADHLPSDVGLVVPVDGGLLDELLVERERMLWRVGAHPGAMIDGDWLRVDIPGKSATFGLDTFQVPGRHNRENLAFALLLATAYGASPRALQKAIGALRPLAHRMEVVAHQHGVRWINDSKATNVAATIAGVSGLDAGGFLLLGGEGKGESFLPLVSHLKNWRVITFGAWGGIIADELDGQGTHCVRASSMEEALKRAKILARSGDTVLLSPGCASFDAYRNFEDRGNQFRRWVTEEAS